MRVLALIAARAGSRGLRHKNIQPVAGVPLLVRAVDLLRAAPRRGESWSIVVSTDSLRYAALARAAGAEVPFLRPRRLARDTSALRDVVLHALLALEERGRSFDVVLLASATTPLTKVDDVRAALRIFKRHHLAVASVTAEARAASWRFSLSRGRLMPTTQQPVGRRQASPVELVLNGALYIATPDWLRRHGRFVASGRTLPYVMPKERSLDIEDTHDLLVAEAVLTQRGENARGRRRVREGREN